MTGPSAAGRRGFFAGDDLSEMPSGGRQIQWLKISRIRGYREYLHDPETGTSCNLLTGSRPGDPRHLAQSLEVSRNATAAPARDGAAAHSRPPTCRTAITRRNRQELAMPDQEHLILVLARDAEEITRDISVFFAPTRDFIEPGADWPQDLTGAELAALIPYLRRTIGSLSDVITRVVADNRADPDKARVVAEGVRLIGQGEEAIRAGETLFGTPPGTRSQQHMAAQDFPDVAATGPVGGVAPEAGLPVPSRPGDNQGPVTRHPR